LSEWINSTREIKLFKNFKDSRLLDDFREGRRIYFVSDYLTNIVANKGNIF